MRNVAAVSSILLLPTAVAQDPWFGEDKKLHFMGSAIMAAAIKEVGVNPNVAFITSVAIGVGKEVYDYKHPAKHSASYKDLIWDIGGAYLGAYTGNCYLSYRNNEVLVTYSIPF